MVRLPFKKPTLTLKARLMQLAGIAIVLPFCIILVGLIFFQRIESANSDRRVVMQIAQSLQEARVAEKAYLQFYKSSYQSDLLAACTKGRNLLATIFLGDAGDELALALDRYQEQFSSVVTLHQESAQLSEQIHQQVFSVQEQLDALARSLQEKEFELVLEGETLSRNENSLLTSCREAKIVSLLLISKLQDLFLTGRQGYVAEFDEFMSRYGKSVLAALVQFSEESGNEEFVKAIEGYPETIEKARVSFGQVEDIFCKEQSTVGELDEIGGRILAQAEEQLEQAHGHAQAAKTQSVTLIGIVTTSGLLLMVVTSIMVMRSITKPLEVTTEVLRDIAQGEGDLTRRLTVRSQDEIGQMSGYFNQFTEKLQTIIKRLSLQATDLTGATAQMSQSTHQMADRAVHMNRQSQDAAGSTQTINETLSQITGSSQQMSGIMNSASTAMDQMAESIAEVARSAEQAAEVARNATTLAEDSESNIKQLGEAANKIGTVVEVIQDIAEQTNLLALNATIEAARAGSAGKGFAVVANEVKELARQTSEATGDIAAMVSGIQDSSGNAVHSVVEISKVIGQINEVSRNIASAVEEQSITTQEVATKVSEVVHTSDRVTDSIVSTTHAAEQMALNINDVSEAAQLTSQEILQNQEAIEMLAHMAEDLQELVGQFKTEEDQVDIQEASISETHEVSA